jgi:solute carrier family 25 phosphate transporter 23/24/25/41
MGNSANKENDSSSSTTTSIGSRTRLESKEKQLLNKEDMTGDDISTINRKVPKEHPTSASSATSTFLKKRFTLLVEDEEDGQQDSYDSYGGSSSSSNIVGVGNEYELDTTIIETLQHPPVEVVTPLDQRWKETWKQLFCGGVAGSIAKTVTAPFSRLAILYQVHSLVTTKQNQPNYAMTLSGGAKKIIDRGGILSLWKGNLTSVIHRFPYSAINFYCYETSLDFLVSHYQIPNRRASSKTTSTTNNATPILRFLAGSISGTLACVVCYPLDLVRTRLTTQLPGKEQYRGIIDAFTKIYCKEGIRGYYSGLGATLLVAVPNFAISYTAYGTLKEHVLEDDLFYNMRRVTTTTKTATSSQRNDGQPKETQEEPRLGFLATLFCGAASGMTSTILTYPCDTIRRRMQIQSLHIQKEMNIQQNFQLILQKEGYRGLYRGLTPELMKVIPMVGVMFTCYEYLKEQLEVT